MPQTDTTDATTAPQLAIFTDFDGTLVELAETPDGIDVPESLAHQIEQTAREMNSAFAVLTGREIADIDKFLSPLILPIAGAHGTQRRRADGVVEEIDPASLSGAEAIARAIEPLVQAHPDLIMETKEGAVALHFRQAPELEDVVRHAMQDAVADNEHFTLVPGKMVLEARPRGVSKGEALRAFMREEPFIGRTPIFIGDDVTDEDGFIAAQDLGGVGIKLGDGDTAARMRIADVVSVRALLQGLGDIAARDREFSPKH
ncbi:trehalose-phosphatase [Devosia sp. J2-20]|jgi:trehalose 6-phosphate phosphatase|uniref:trehalose-phosphatase n=1 Tax=Devosia TaxID=46913 RepID=UPI0022B05237|nr:MULTISPECIES: trehalose-phosphatase [Devosia]MCZ4347202.1 trehalose-phosphatase [Devosia neptuniae]WDQ99440.1 trehalose-phosphatase [Devosia sp. J2-20]|tara:strand:+ start:8788 stop:9564 length:777 start_codon:yes stop_codon:yes gene_type:complete